MAVETLDLAPAAQQTDSATTVETDGQTESTTVASVARLNHNEVVDTAPLPIQLEGSKGFWQKLEPPTIDPVNLALTPITFATTAESVEAPVEDVTSFGREFSPPTVELAPTMVLEPNVEAVNTEPETEPESFRHSFIKPEPSFRHSFVESQNSRQALTEAAVNMTTAGLKVPAMLDQTAYLQSPLSYCQSAKLTSGRILSGRHDG